LRTQTIWKVRRRGLFTVLAASVSAIATASVLNRVGMLEISELDFGLDGVAVFLPDLHIHLRNDYFELLLELIEEIGPTTVVLGGDLVDELTTDLSYVEFFISSIRSVEKFFVLGNHEYWSGLADWVRKTLMRYGYVELSSVQHRSVVGPIYGLDWRQNRVYPQITVEGIVFVHDPNAADYIAGDALILAGHTHGGVVLGGITLLSNSKYVRGFYTVRENVRLYVSRGLGQMYPLRFTSSPELVVLK